MITKEFEKFEKELLKKEKVDIMKNFQIVEALYHEAVMLGVIPLKDPLDGFEVDIKIAKIINSVPKTSKKNSS
ncbi:MAG: hypothetical protein NG747_10340 [Candidatus Brocadia sp.]|nr:hypothetical protein [Candidatus Brocadia sp.]NUO08761.1 hypothetical protein [Candidatus Brocadia sp.]